MVFPFVNRAVVATRLDRQNIKGLSLTVPVLTRNDLSPVLIANMVPPDDDARVPQRIAELESAAGIPVSSVIHYDPMLIFDDDFSRVADPGSQFRQAIVQTIELLGISGS